MANDDDEHGPVSVSASGLGEFEMLAGVGLGARNDIVRYASERLLRPTEVLIEQGGTNLHMYLLMDGELGVFLEKVEGEPIAVINPGETVGELSVLDASKASAHVVATKASRVLALDESSFWNLTNVSHAFAVNLLVKLAERLRANNDAVSKNVKQRRQYERAAMFDGLTGIHNRRWLDETLDRMLARHQRGAGTLSVGLIDIDHFKSFNDTYGHDAGDHVLTVVAGTLEHNLRPTDMVARYGGEEFVLIFPETALDQAAIAAERVRAAVAAQVLEMPNGTKLPNVTISMGIAQYSKETAAELLKAADQAMYRAKQGGRNRVELARAAFSADTTLPGA